jgi:DNA-binding MarR family transcriptional regulator
LTRTGPKPRHSINYWVHALSSSLAKGAASYYGRKFQIVLPEMRILSTLFTDGDLTARDLVSLTAMDKAMVSRVLAGLSRQGHVELLENGDRTRLRSWTLTRSGRAFVARLKPEWIRREAIIQAGLSKSEHALLVRLLERLFWASEELRAEEQKEWRAAAENAPRPRRRKKL